MDVASLVPVYLRCEYAVNPIGIDTLNPRLSWELESTTRGQYQSAWQVQVASSPELLNAGRPDLWDSGRVANAQTAQIVYSGAPLASRQRCYWHVQVWNQNGIPSAVSSTATWEMGLLSTSDWQSQWIGLQTWGISEEQSARDSLKGCPWVWGPAQVSENKPGNNSDCYMRKEICLKAAPEWAWLLITADTSFYLYVNGREVARGAAWNGPLWVDLRHYLIAGRNVVAITGHKQSVTANGVAAKLTIASAGDSIMHLQLDASWQASGQPEPGWAEPGFNAAHWPAAVVSTACVSGTRESRSVAVPAPCPYLRRDFQVTKPVTQARLYITSLGLYEAYLNGSKVGNNQLTPGWTDYRRHLQYQVYDVTGLVHLGENKLGAVLGDGWYTGYTGGFGREQYGGYPLGLLAQLEVEYADSTSLVVPTDANWQGSTGPLLHSDLLMGEAYDAQQNLVNWTSPSALVGNWRPITVLPAPGTTLVAQQGPPIQVTQEIVPVAVTCPSTGVYIIDMGQNMVGKYRLRARGATGTIITLRFGEMLNQDGTLYVENLRSARQTDVYVLAGDDCEEVYEPHFTFHGFRYVELHGYPGVPDQAAVTGLVTHTACASTGSFACSDPMVNKLQSNIVWGQRGNFVSTPTDCPQRDERAGWSGDAQVFVRTACFNMDAATFYTKYMVALSDGQLPSGSFPHVAPSLSGYGAGSPAWGDAGVIVPWTVYQMYGDTRILVDNYAAMKRWMDYLEQASENYLRPAEGFGDWLSVAADTPKEVLSTAFFAYSAKLMAQTAQALQIDTDALRYHNLFAAIRDAFVQAFMQPDGRIHGDTQTCYVMALHIGLHPPALRSAIAEHLVRTIKEKNWHLSTGFVGVGWLLPVLTLAGHTEVAYRLLHNDTYPSWGYSIRQGATTIWERWNSYTKENGFGDVGMNSFNHYSLGSVGEWLYRFAAGIDSDPEQPGYRSIIIRPRLGGHLTWVKAEYRSIHGLISSHWQKQGNQFLLDVTIPANCTARVFVPLGAQGFLQESGKVVLPRPDKPQTQGVEFLGSIDGCAELRVGGGSYAFATW